MVRAAHTGGFSIPTKDGVWGPLGAMGAVVRPLVPTRELEPPGKVAMVGAIGLETAA